MSNEPTAQAAMAAYVAAVAYHHRGAVDQPTIDKVEQLTPDSFRINGKTRIWPTMGFCSYNASTGLWSVSLLDGAIVKVRDTGDGFVIVVDSG